MKHSIAYADSEAIGNLFGMIITKSEINVRSTNEGKQVKMN